MAKTQVSWTLDEVEVLQSHPFAEDLLARLPRHTSVAISSKRRSLGIYMSREQRSVVRLRSQCHMPKRLIDQDLTLNCLPDSVFQVLVGSILGDGCVYAARGGECHFQERHGDKQVEYLCWKQEMLKIFHAKDAEKVKPHGKWRSCILRTGVHPIFTQIRRDWYNTRLAGVEKKAQIPKYADQRLSLLGLLVWYLDDGTCGSNYIHLRIAGGTWPSADLERVVSALNTRFGLHMRVLHSDDPRDMNHTVSIDAQDRNFLLPVWRKLASQLHLPEQIMYKLPPPTQKLRRCFGIIRRSDGREFVTQREAAAATSITPSGIQAVLAGRQRTAGGFGWEYISRKFI